VAAAQPQHPRGRQRRPQLPRGGVRHRAAPGDVAR
jgi:hypothetical protein